MVSDDLVAIYDTVKSNWGYSEMNYPHLQHLSSRQRNYWFMTHINLHVVKELAALSLLVKTCAEFDSVKVMQHVARPITSLMRLASATGWSGTLFASVLASEIAKEDQNAITPPYFMLELFSVMHPLVTLFEKSDHDADPHRYIHLHRSELRMTVVRMSAVLFNFVTSQQWTYELFLPVLEAQIPKSYIKSE